MNKSDTWAWLRKVDRKIRSEAVIFATQEQAVRIMRINYVKYDIDGTAESPLCRVFRAMIKATNHIVKAWLWFKRSSYCNVARILQWILCKKYIIANEKWYVRKPDFNIENEAVKVT